MHALTEQQPCRRESGGPGMSPHNHPSILIDGSAAQAVSSYKNVAQFVADPSGGLEMCRYSDLQFPEPGEYVPQQMHITPASARCFYRLAMLEQGCDGMLFDG